MGRTPEGKGLGCAATQALSSSHHSWPPLCIRQGPLISSQWGARQAACAVPSGGSVCRCPHCPLRLLYAPCAPPLLCLSGGQGSFRVTTDVEKLIREDSTYRNQMSSRRENGGTGVVRRAGASIRSSAAPALRQLHSSRRWLRSRSGLNDHGLLQQRAHGLAGLGAHCRQGGREERINGSQHMHDTGSMQRQVPACQHTD